MKFEKIIKFIVCASPLCSAYCYANIQVVFAKRRLVSKETVCTAASVVGEYKQIFSFDTAKRLKS